MSRPSKIVCTGRSFRPHAIELGNPVPTRPIFFLKATTSIIGPGEPIILPPESEEVHHEAEVAMIVGAPMRNVDSADALSKIVGWTVLNDVTARDLQRADKGRFTRAKGFDTFCPLSDVRLPSLPWAESRIQCWVDGSLRQDDTLANLLFTPGAILAEVTRCMTLLPGDIVSLGTPAGVASLEAGNTVEVRLVGSTGDTLISLSNPVQSKR